MTETPTGRGALFAGGLAAILASTCCLGPLALVALGFSGAWIGNLTLLEPYKPVFIAVAAVFIGLGFWQVYLRPKPKCEDGSYCARPQSSLITQIALWIATALVRASTSNTAPSSSAA